MKSPLFPVACGLFLLASAAAAESPASKARAIDIATKGKESPKVAGKLNVLPKGSLDVDLTFFRVTGGKVAKAIAVAEGEARVRFTFYYENDKPFYVIAQEDSRQQSTDVRLSFSANGRMTSIVGKAIQGGKTVRNWTKTPTPTIEKYYKEEARRILAQKGSK